MTIETPIDALKRMAALGVQVELGYFPNEFWPDEANVIPEDKRWDCCIVGVPGTDMLVFGPHKAATLEEAITTCVAELDAYMATREQS